MMLACICCHCDLVYLPSLLKKKPASYETGANGALNSGVNCKFHIIAACDAIFDSASSPSYR